MNIVYILTHTLISYQHYFCHCVQEFFFNFSVFCFRFHKTQFHWRTTNVVSLDCRQVFFLTEKVFFSFFVLFCFQSNQKCIQLLIQLHRFVTCFDNSWMRNKRIIDIDLVSILCHLVTIYWPTEPFIHCIICFFFFFFISCSQDTRFERKKKKVHFGQLQICLHYEIIYLTTAQNKKPLNERSNYQNYSTLKLKPYWLHVYCWPLFGMF